MIETANAADLYWKVVDRNGKLLANVSADSTLVASSERQLQATFPGIKLSIEGCRQPTFVEATDPVYGKSWQCGPLVYRGTVVHPPAPPIPVVKFPPDSSQWHYLGPEGNDVLFSNQPHRDGEGIYVWTESYDVGALSDAIRARGVEAFPAEMITDMASQAVQRAAEEIVKGDPAEIGGSTYRTNRRAQKELYEIDCASGQIRRVQTIVPDGTVYSSGPGWIKPMPGWSGRWKLMKAQCAQ